MKYPDGGADIRRFRYELDSNLYQVSCSKLIVQDFGSLCNFDIHNFRISIDMDFCGFARTVSCVFRCQLDRRCFVIFVFRAHYIFDMFGSCSVVCTRDTFLIAVVLELRFS